MERVRLSLLPLVVIFAMLGIAQTSLALLSLITKITPFGRDFCYTRHNSNKFGSALAYRKNSYILRISFVEDMMKV